MRFLFFIVGSIFLSSCASMPAVEIKVLNLPDIGVVSEANVGESMLRQGYGYISNKIEIIDPAFLDELPVRGKYTVEGRVGSVLMLANEGVFLRLDESNGNICKYVAFRVWEESCTSGVLASYKKSKEIDYVESNFLQQTLLYNGRIGNRIMFSYREFGGGYARSGFTNDVEYDLSESKQVGYRGALIDVIDANNMRIKYRVIRSF